jgi:TonB family protein
MTFQALLFCPDEKTARVTTQVLNELEFSVEACVEPFAAVKKLMGQHFDAIVVDCDNEQNASLLFKSARNSNSNQASLSVAVVEGQTGVANAFRLGANLVLTKPINVEQAKSTLRVARGLLRKGGDAKATSANASTPAAANPTSSPAPRLSQSREASRPAPAITAAPRTSAPAFQPAKPAAAAAAVAKTAIDPGVLDIEDEQVHAGSQGEEILFDSPSEEAPKKNAAVSTKDYAWQPPTTPADAMSVAMRRAAEVADSVPSVESSASAASAKSTFDAPRSSSSSFGSSGAASAPAPAREVPTPPQRIAPASVAPSSTPASLVRDLASDDQSDENNGGNKKLLIAAVAAVVLLAAGYFGWSSMHGKSEAPKASAQTAAPAQSAPAPTSQPPATQATQEIEIGLPSGPAQSGTQRPASAPSSAHTNRPAADSDTEDKEPEITVTHPDKPALVVKGDSKRSAAPSKEQQSTTSEDVAPALIAGNSDPSAISNIMQSAPVSVPRVAAPRETLKVSQGVTQGLLLKRVQPNYPTQARQMRLQGSVLLQATIAATGNISSIKVLNGEPSLARAAVEAVKQWKYKPYYLNGEPVDIQTQITINFKLP